jgi:NADH-quinone oxidoreductase subunit F
MSPSDVIGVVDASGLRGRGGAGFPTGRKWSFIPKDSPKARYVVCNCDEGEPGTFHDREIMELDPHSVLEGIAIASYAIGGTKAFAYIRGEMTLAYERMSQALADATAHGYLGEKIFGSGYSIDIVLHRGAGAYICGEETALLESLEGYRGMPRPRPPFPAIEGLYASPTVVNNTQTLASVPPIVVNGPEWFRQWGTERSPGTMVFSVSGAVNRPGNYEIPLGMPARDVLEIAGGVTAERGGLKAFTPGGSSTPLLTEAHLDTPMDFESIQAAGSILGTGAVIVIPRDYCIVRAVLRWMEFYEHESCGKCTPCREGTYWLSHVLRRIETGHGRSEDLALLDDVADNILGKVLCGLGDGAASPVQSSIKYFRDEYEAHVRHRGCPMLAATAGAKI